MADLIFFMSFTLLLLGLFYCEIESWRDRPFTSNGVTVAMPYLLDVGIQSNMNDCLFKQQLKPESGLRNIEHKTITGIWDGSSHNSDQESLQHIMIHGDEKIRLPDVIIAHYDLQSCDIGFHSHSNSFTESEES